MSGKKPKGIGRPLLVWIELPKPADKAHADQLCDLANKMLQRLEHEGDPPLVGGRRGFFWSEHENKYCFGNGMGYMTLTDSGEWFNLEHLAGKETKT